MNANVQILINILLDLNANSNKICKTSCEYDSNACKDCIDNSIMLDPIPGRCECIS